MWENTWANFALYNFWPLKYCVPSLLNCKPEIPNTSGALTKPLIENQVALNAITFTICNHTTIIVYNYCAFFLNLSTHYIYFVKFIWKKSAIKFLIEEMQQYLHICWFLVLMLKTRQSKNSEQKSLWMELTSQYIQGKR